MTGMVNRSQGFELGGGAHRRNMGHILAHWNYSVSYSNGEHMTVGIRQNTLNKEWILIHAKFKK